MADPSNARDHNLSMYKIELQEENKSSYESARYMSSKIRLTRKMGSSSNNPSSYKSNSIISRVCADCNTSSTPLWRTGPNGPKVIFFSLLSITMKLLILIQGFKLWNGFPNAATILMCLLSCL
ncbi:putative transcription factor C2C2-GATA family [Lupinus albus]|uniref:Putative transcription factor C2C2-GATA family n=1 Tax=Lupinus albus TaxID=3870 RepID=A0A6A4PPY1_LUPAL|nr:putative transcription factor C2C2-GATA family [Lupinus albus]